jgi:hypothetical protein
MLIGITKILGTNPLERFVPGKPKIANHQIEFWESLIQQRFPLVVVLQSFAQGVPHQTNMVAFDELQFRRAGDGQTKHRDDKQQKSVSKHSHS